MDTMKVAVLEGLSSMRMDVSPIPELRPGTVKIRLEACGICGSDVHLYTHGAAGKFVVDYPFVLGHECAGQVVEIAPGVSHLQPGDRVALEPAVPCGHCPQCRAGRYNLCPEVRCLAAPPVPGCLQEYLVYNADFAYKLPPGMTAEQGALLEPLAVALHACEAGNIHLGDTVLVAGAGCIGIMCLLAAKAMGAAQVIVSDTVPARLELARRLGAFATNPATGSVSADVLAQTQGAGANVVIDAAGFAATMNQNLVAVAPGGTVVQVGLGEDVFSQVEIAPLLQKEVTYKGIFRYVNNYPAAIEAVAAGRIDLSQVVSHRYTFDETPRAFSEAVSCKNEITKGVIVF